MLRSRTAMLGFVVLIAVLAVGCYSLAFPTIKAQQFSRLVASQNYELADTCFRNPEDGFLDRWNEKHWRFKAEAELATWSFSELLRGVRQVRIRVMFGDAGPLRSREWLVTSTRGGLLPPEPTYLTGVFGGLMI